MLLPLLKLSLLLLKLSLHGIPRTEIIDAPNVLAFLTLIENVTERFFDVGGRCRLMIIVGIAVVVVVAIILSKVDVPSR